MLVLCCYGSSVSECRLVLLFYNILKMEIELVNIFISLSIYINMAFVRQAKNVCVCQVCHPAALSAGRAHVFV